jgi:hypothetical protein
VQAIKEGYLRRASVVCDVTGATFTMWQVLNQTIHIVKRAALCTVVPIVDLSVASKVNKQTSTLSLWGPSKSIRPGGVHRRNHSFPRSYVHSKLSKMVDISLGEGAYALSVLI